MKITIFGFPGTGTSSTGKMLADKLGYNFLSTGNMLRAKASELGMSINEFDELCLKDSQFDLAVDQEVAKYGRENDNFIFDSRLAWYFIPDSIKFKLVCEPGEALRRIAQREDKTVDQVLLETDHRQEKVGDRYKRYYGLANYDADDNFDLVIDTTKLDLDQVVETIVNYIQTRT